MIFRLITTAVEKVEQEVFINKIATKNSRIIKAYNLLTEDKSLE